MTQDWGAANGKKWPEKEREGLAPSYQAAGLPEETAKSLAAQPIGAAVMG